MAAHQAPLSLGFSRKEHWSGLPLPSPVHESEKWKWSRSVVPDSSRPHGPQPTRLLHPWDFPGKSTGVGCHCLLQIYWLVLTKIWLKDPPLDRQRDPDALSVNFQQLQLSSTAHFWGLNTFACPSTRVSFVCFLQAKDVSWLWVAYPFQAEQINKTL